LANHNNNQNWKLCVLLAVWLVFAFACQKWMQPQLLLPNVLSSHWLDSAVFDVQFFAYTPSSIYIINRCQRENAGFCVFVGFVSLAFVECLGLRAGV
jgi:hypothetical protein